MNEVTIITGPDRSYEEWQAVRTEKPRDRRPKWHIACPTHVVAYALGDDERLARLIAAAPELLAFIQACLDCDSADSLHDFVVNNAEAVIAKAKAA